MRSVPEQAINATTTSSCQILPYVGVFGGTFDPPHLGHRKLAEQAISHLGLHKLWVIPAGIPVHRQVSGRATVSQRLSWVKRTFEDLPQVQVQCWEIQQEAIPAIHTLRWINQEMPEVVPVWLMGLDAWLHIREWVGYPEHQQRCHVVVFRRGDGHCPVYSGWKELPLEQWKLSPPQGYGHVVFVDAEISDVSASDIRVRVMQAGHDASDEILKGLVRSGLEGEIQTAYMQTGVEEWMMNC